ncbi:hypothetical protein [Ammoniphilus sp. YIM 78166]|uniref:hypothetical protein n=1 Tax=Ammoniphilus sp. YIM 78166 TaxID=1644106 RepID=UPI00107039B9|nr:hypothetical protein [Ammoniphilus sp. YIM 78166]
MEEFLAEIYTINQISILESIKKNIKDQVVDPSLGWQDRIILYRKVQIINEYILHLQSVNERVAKL